MWTEVPHRVSDAEEVTHQWVGLCIIIIIIMESIGTHTMHMWKRRDRILRIPAGSFQGWFLPKMDPTLC